MGTPAAASIFVKLSANPHQLLFAFRALLPLFWRLSIGNYVRLISRCCTSDSRLRNRFLVLTVFDSGTPAVELRCDRAMIHPCYLL